MSRLLEDCRPFAERHRGKHKTSGPHWSTIIRFVALYDYAREMEETLLKIHAGASRKNAWWCGYQASETLKKGDTR